MWCGRTDSFSCPACPGIDLASGKIVDGGIEEQTEASLAALKHALEAAGSSMEKVVKATVYVSNAAHFAKVNRVYARHFPDKPPPEPSSPWAPGPWSSTSRPSASPWPDRGATAGEEGPWRPTSS
ncbi:RidA family protein [Craurococcus roseus]|uniref:RidA family protein n=1 Tax=Craurococcus roseus TaxID=77585 RepID=UPI0038D0FA45